MDRYRREWTDVDLALLRRLDSAGHGIGEIARRMDREEASILDHLSVLRAREGEIPGPDPAALEWNGPDEEGDVAPPTGRAEDDPSAWVHSEPNR